jgi:hypothetical protein
MPCQELIAYKKSAPLFCVKENRGGGISLQLRDDVISVCLDSLTTHSLSLSFSLSPPPPLPLSHSHTTNTHTHSLTTHAPAHTRTKTLFF